MSSPLDIAFLVNQQLQFSKSLQSSMQPQIDPLDIKAKQQASIWQLTSCLSLYLVEIQFSEQPPSLSHFKKELLDNPNIAQRDSRFAELKLLLSDDLSWLSIIVALQKSLYERTQSHFFSPSSDENIIALSTSTSKIHWSSLALDQTVLLAEELGKLINSQRQNAIEC